MASAALMGLTTSGAPREVFRYTSEDGGQEHHMSMEMPMGMPQVKGGWAYTSPEGEEKILEYTADTNGFLPVADYLPEPIELLGENQVVRASDADDFT